MTLVKRLLREAQWLDARSSITSARDCYSEFRPDGNALARSALFRSQLVLKSVRLVGEERSKLS
jgi:hypothetical protein